MSERIAAHRPGSEPGDPDAGGLRHPEELQGAPAAFHGLAPGRALLGLQRSVGNAAVIQMLRVRDPIASRGALPTAPRADEEREPVPPGVATAQQDTPTTGAAPAQQEAAPSGAAPAQQEAAPSGAAPAQQDTPTTGAAPAQQEAALSGAASAQQGGPATEAAGSAQQEEPSPESLVGEVSALEEGEVPTQAERAEKRAERNLPPDSEEAVDTGGGPFPIAESAPVADAFEDAGREGSVPFGDALDDGFDPLNPEGDLRPHAFTAGGRTGTKAWAGGGGAGPKGNQPAGSIQDKVDPDYDSSWGGFTENASAWVMEGTGTIGVKRDYVSSSSGDQGNGWYVTDKAAAALEKHEQKHVAQTRSVYVDKIQPLLDRIVNSYNYGKGKVYKSSDAKLLVKRYVDWPASVKAFDEDDNAWNAPGGSVDTEDQGSSYFPNQIGPGTVNGKEFQNRLKLPTEEAPPK